MIEPRLMSREQAAAYTGFPLEVFDGMVRTGNLPSFTCDFGEGPRWDRHRIDHAIGYVYVMLFDGYVKIGWSRDVEKRQRDLQIGVPNDLWLFWFCHGGRPLERDLHQRFDAQRTRGEWFRLEGDLADWIAEGCPL